MVAFFFHETPFRQILHINMIGPPRFFSQVCRRTLHPAAYEIPLIQSFFISFPGNTSPLLPGPVSSEEPTPSEPLKGTPYHTQYFFIRHQACRPVHGSGISPSPRGSRRAASRRKYHCQNSSGHGRSRCKRYCTLKDFPLSYKRHCVPVQAHGICQDIPADFSF